MATIAQITANQENAKHSTGPRTDEGKASASQNARKHGLSAAKFCILPTENQEEFDALLDSLFAEHQPATATETFLVTEMAQSQWKLRRVAKIEADLYGDENPAEIFAADAGNDQTLMKLTRYEEAARRAWYKALNQLRQLRNQPAARPASAETEICKTNPTPERVAPASTPENDNSKSNPMPPHLERELALHKRRDPLFDPHHDRTQMSKALQKWFAA